jgi:translation initiation factor IF-2
MSEETKANEAVEQPAQNAELTVQDLASIKQIIDVASQRGAFKPDEMVVVGTTYSKLSAFLSVVQAQQAQANQDAPQGE